MKLLDTGMLNQLIPASIKRRNKSKRLDVIQNVNGENVLQRSTTLVDDVSTICINFQCKSPLQMSTFNF